MVVLTVEDVSKAYGMRTLFEDVSLGLHDTDRVAVIGRNGSGKSTLLRILAGVEAPDDGVINRNNDSRIEFLTQDPDLPQDVEPIEAVLDDESPRFRAVRNYEHAARRAAEAPDDEAASEEFAKWSMAMTEHDGWSLEAEALAMLDRLGVPATGTTVAQLSGGQRRRVAMARALMVPCDLLVLDEPTNHLDVDTIEWLEEYLAQRSGALLLVTHDRYVLDRVTNVILEIADGTVYRHEGNYSYYLEARDERERQQLQAEQKRKQLARKELEWLRRGPKARTTKARYRVEKAEALQEAGIVPDDSKVEFDFVGSRLGRKIMAAENLTKSWGDLCVVDDFTYTFKRGERVGIVGPNGAGKTTLLELLAQRIEPDSGFVDVGETVVLGYVDQEGRKLDPEQRAFDAVNDINRQIRTSEGTISASKMLDRFLFEGDKKYGFIEKLSGGEKRRLQLLMVLMGEPNVLFLDEPTNDLDVETLTVLEDYLDGFDGVVVVVSHDRFFLDRNVEHLLEVFPGGKIVEFPGTYTVWAEAKAEREAEEQRAAREAAVAAEQLKSAAPAPKMQQEKLSYKEQREYDALTERIAEIEARIPALDEEMVTHAADHERLGELSEERQALTAELEVAFERWMELEERA